MAAHIDGPLYYERMGRSGRPVVLVMRVMPGAGHACRIEQPWLFDRYMLEFLARHALHSEGPAR